MPLNAPRFDSKRVLNLLMVTSARLPLLSCTSGERGPSEPRIISFMRCFGSLLWIFGPLRSTPRAALEGALGVPTRLFGLSLGSTGVPPPRPLPPFWIILFARAI